MLSKWRRESKQGRSKPANKHDGYTAQQIEDTPIDTLRPLPIEKPSSSVLDSLSSHDLARLPPETLSQLPPKTLSRLPPNAFRKLTPEVLAQITTLPEETLAELPIRDLSYLHPSAIANLPVDRLILLPPETLSRLPWSTIVKLPPDTLTRLPTSTLITLPPETLARLSSDALSQLPHRVRHRLPPDLLDAFKPLPSQMLSPTTPQQVDPHLPQQEQFAEENDKVGRSISNSSVVRNQPVRQDDVPQETSREVLSSLQPVPGDTRDYILQKRASRRNLNRETQANIENGYGTTSQSPAINPSSPFTAGGPSVQEFQQFSESNQRRSGSHHRSQNTTQRSSPDPTPTTQLEQRANTAALGARETRVPSSGSQKSVATQRSTRQSWLDTRPERTPTTENQNMGHRPVSLDSRVPGAQRPYGMVEERSQERSSRQSSANVDNQLQMLLLDRERVITELRATLDTESQKEDRLRSSLLEAQAQLQRQADYSERQLADLRACLAREQAQQEQKSLVLAKAHDEELGNQRNDLQRRIKDLKVELLAQKSTHDVKIREQRRLLETEQASSKKSIDELTAMYEGKLEKQKIDSLNRLTTCEQEMHDKQAQYKDKLQQLEQELRGRMSAFANDANKQTSQHEQQVQAMQYQLREQETNHQTQVTTLTEKHLHEIQTLNDRHQADTAQAKHSMAIQIQSLRAQYEDQIQADRSHFGTEMRIMSDNHQHLLHQQKLEYDQMVKLLRSSGSDFTRQSNNIDLINNKFNKLKLAVEVITSPFNLGAVTILENSRLDPTGFLQREKGMQLPLLRSLVWSRIMDGFFSAPFGFGVLGSGTGKQMLVDLFLFWRKLVAGQNRGNDTSDEASVADVSFDLYDTWQDTEANKWRSATFQSIMAVMVKRGPERGSPDKPGKTAENIYETNRAKVKNDIIDMLAEATQRQVAGEIDEKVTEVTSLAGELAFEIGAHPGCLVLEFPEKGDVVCIGADFIDCHDGYATRGESEEVELVVCPRFLRVGDGRNDVTTRKSIFPGEIYPVRTRSSGEPES